MPRPYSEMLIIVFHNLIKVFYYIRNLGYSIIKYFSIVRAFGIDHFDESYRSRPLVKEGIFRFTPNAMYIFGFTLLWAPAFYFSSVAALAFAFFSHLYIWVHYFCTEKPDMERIYGILNQS